MKKFITYFLIFALSLTSAPVTAFAQDAGYKPAFSFEYNQYKLGKTNTQQFIANLEDDLLNYEDLINPKDLAPKPKPGAYGNKWGSPAHLRESYNNFLYYNIYPEESPLWNKTALIPGNGVAEKDVMAILDHHHSVSEAIAYRFKQNPAYKDQRNEKYVRLVPTFILIALICYFTWEIAPEIVTGAIPCLASMPILKTVTSIAIMVVLDALITDQVAWHMVQSDERLKYLFQSVGSYKNSAIKVSIQTDLLKPVKETEYERIEQELQEITKGKKHSISSRDTRLLKKFLKKGYGKIDVSKRDELKPLLGKFLYDIFDGDEVLINEYFRKELLRTYYALVFIEEELDNQNDPLRYDRAIIDLATTYKIQNILILDGRLIKRKNKTRVMSYGENLQQLQGTCNIKDGEKREWLEYVDEEIEAELGAELADQTSVATTYPTMLTRAEVNYLVQLMDINRQEENAAGIRDIQRRIDKRANDDLNPPNYSTTR